MVLFFGSLELCMLSDVREELEEVYGKREEVLRRRRGIVPACQEGVIYSLRGDVEGAEEKRREAIKLIRDCERVLEGFPALKSKLLGSGYQEYAELVILQGYIENGEVPDVDVPGVYYLLGLLDAVGEIKRYAMLKLGDGDLETAEVILRDLEDIYSEVNVFSYPNSIVPGLKRKKDVARGVINDLSRNIVSAKI